MDWDKIPIFYAVAEAKSFTHAAETLNMSQSALSRQIRTLETSLNAQLFHRHARGLTLTEQGELLFRTAREMTHRLETACSRIADLQERPSGTLRVTTTLGLGTNWLTPRLGDFLKLYPDIQLELILSDEELDLSARQADIGIRLRSPDQAGLIQRRLFTVHFHVYAATSYLERHGIPHSVEDLDHHTLLSFSGERVPEYLSIPWLSTIGRPTHEKRPFHFEVNNLTALKRATEQGFGLAILPDYLIDSDSNLVKTLADFKVPSLDSYLVYPEAVRNVARVRVLRDFLVTKARGWVY